MRSLPLHCGAIQIASVAGESRRIGVSGLAKARLLWLFRNFSILEFPVLSKKQQQLVAQVWNAGTGMAPKDARRDVIGPQIIGTIEAFSPQLVQLRTPVQLRMPAQLRTPAHTRSSSRPPARYPIVASLPDWAILSALSLVLLGTAIYLGPRYFLPKHPSPLQTGAATVAETKQPLPLEATTPGGTFTEPATPVAVLPTAAVASVPVAARPVSAPVSAPVEIAPALTPIGLPSAMAHDTSKYDTYASDTSSPDPSAPDASSLQVSPPRRRTAAGSAKPQENLEILIRVSVDSSGQARSFQVMSGDPTKKSAALRAARQWNFQPCAGPEGCEHVLKFADRGDSSMVKMIE